MQRHRVFIAINLPEDIKKKLADYQKKWPELPIRWTKPDNIHITLVFLGYLTDEELVGVCKIIKEVALKHSPFFINLSKICYGPTDQIPPRPPKFLETVVIDEKKPVPPQKFRRPRMIWATGEKSEEFASLKENLDKVLGNSEKREFSPHITLGRIQQWQWRRIEPEERPAVDKEINLSFSVDSIEIMESVLKRGGAEYTVLESHNLGSEK